MSRGGVASGRCLCGSVSYECDGDPEITALCHCDDCQRESGSSFSVNVAVAAETVRISGEEALRVFETVGTDTGERRLRKFCGECGSTLFTILSEMPHLVFLKAGTLDDRDPVDPATEIWTERAQPWLQRDGARTRFPRDFQA